MSTKIIWVQGPNLTRGLPEEQWTWEWDGVMSWGLQLQILFK